MDQFRKLMKIGEYLFGTHGLNFAPKIFLNVLQLKDTYSMLFMNMQIRFYHVMNANVYARCVCVCVCVTIIVITLHFIFIHLHPYPLNFGFHEWLN